MSATRSSIYLETRVGLAVRIDRPGHPQHEALGWIVQLSGRTALVESAKSSFRCWFSFEELIDERIDRTERVIAVARELAVTISAVAAGQVRHVATAGLVNRLKQQITGLDWLEQESCRRLQALRT